MKIKIKIKTAQGSVSIEAPDDSNIYDKITEIIKELSYEEKTENND